MSSNALLSMAGWYFLPNVRLSTITLHAFVHTNTVLKSSSPATSNPSYTPSSSVPATLNPLLIHRASSAIAAAARSSSSSRIYSTPSMMPTGSYDRPATSTEISASRSMLAIKPFRAGFDGCKFYFIPCKVGLPDEWCRTVQYHPDKVSGADRAAVEAIYVRLQLARDTLVDPAKRFAYDRFGPEILQWQGVKTIRDYVFTGVQNIAGYYIGTGGVLVLLSVLGYLQSGKFWRYWVMAALFLLELHVMTRPTFPAVLSNFVNPVLATTRTRPPYLPFQLLALLRKLAVTFFIAMTQLSPLLKAAQPQVSPDGSISPQQLKNLDDLAMATDMELTRLFRQEVTPFAVEESAMRALKGSLRDWLVQNTVQNDPEVKVAIAGVLERRRGEVRQVAS